MYKFPPATLIKDLKNAPSKSNLWIAGLVIVRQRPRTANGTLFITLEDETGTANIICWKNVFQKYKSTAIFSQLLLVNGILQKEESVTNIIAIKLEDISYLLDEIEKINLFKSL
tara:strand:- start:140 stop:481 length:342 start_codon:yes stop_codon:yes gene_type:complete